MENKFGVFIKKLREENKYTLRNFAKVLKKSPTFVSKVEKGESLPGTETLVKMSELLGHTDIIFRLADKIQPDIEKMVKRPYIIKLLRCFDKLSYLEKRQLVNYIENKKCCSLNEQDEVDGNILVLPSGCPYYTTKNTCDIYCDICAEVADRIVYRKTHVSNFLCSKASCEEALIQKLDKEEEWTEEELKYEADIISWLRPEPKMVKIDEFALDKISHAWIIVGQLDYSQGLPKDDIYNLKQGYYVVTTPGPNANIGDIVRLHNVKKGDVELFDATPFRRIMASENLLGGQVEFHTQTFYVWYAHKWRLLVLKESKGVKLGQIVNDDIYIGNGIYIQGDKR